jgi:hypothetical protein
MMAVEMRTPYLRRFEGGCGSQVNMSAGRPLVLITGANIAKETAAVCVDGEWFIRPDSAERRRVEDIWRAAQP